MAQTPKALYLAVLSRGDRRLDPCFKPTRNERSVLNFDSWHEVIINAEIWPEAFAACGNIYPDFLCFKRKNKNEILHLGSLDSGVQKELFYGRSLGKSLSENHRRLILGRAIGCIGCGVCPDLNVKNHLKS